MSSDPATLRALAERLRNPPEASWAEIMELAADALDAAAQTIERLESALVAVEFVWMRQYQQSAHRECPSCGGAEPPDWREPNVNEGHRQTCLLALALVEARSEQRPGETP